MTANEDESRAQLAIENVKDRSQDTTRIVEQQWDQEDSEYPCGYLALRWPCSF